MNYEMLLKDAWRMTWRNRFMWVLGLFAGGTSAGVSYQGSMPIGPANGSPSNVLPPNALPMMQEAFIGATRWVFANLAFVVFLVVLGITIFLTLLVVSFIARGAVVRAAVDLEAGQPTSLSAAWRAGRHLFWRQVRLTLVLAGLGICVALVVVGLIAMPIFAGSIFGTGRPVGIMLALLVGVPAALLLVVGGTVLGIVVNYALRAIVVDGVGAVDSLRLGWRTLRAHKSASVLTLLVSIAAMIGAAFVMVVVLIAILAVGGGIGVAIWAMAGMTPPFIAYAIVAVLLIFGILVVLSAIINTFFWNYWTLAYLRINSTTPAAAQSHPVESPSVE